MGGRLNLLGSVLDESDDEAGPLSGVVFVLHLNSVGFKSRKLKVDEEREGEGKKARARPY